MFRRHAIAILFALLLAGIAVPFSTPFVFLALAPLYVVAVARGLRLTILLGLCILAAQAVKMDDAIELPAATVFVAGTIAAARFVVLRREAAARERELLAQAAANEERLRIARELHDAVGHDVSLMVVQAEALAAVTGDERADAIAALGRRTMGEMHRTLKVLRDEAALAPQHGLRDLGEVIEGARQAGVPITYAVEGTPRELAAPLDASAFRIVQEAVTNVIRHAGAAAAAVTVRYREDALELRVTDEGRGGPPGRGARTGVPDDDASARRGEGRAPGHGLVGMRERVAAFGGTLEAGPRAGGGFEVHAELRYG